MVVSLHYYVVIKCSIIAFMNGYFTFPLEHLEMNTLRVGYTIIHIRGRHSNCVNYQKLKSTYINELKPHFAGVRRAVLIIKRAIIGGIRELARKLIYL